MRPFSARRTVRLVAALGAAVLLSAATVLPALAAEPPITDVEAIKANALAQADSIKAGIPGFGVGGPVVTLDEAIVVPINVQVIASPNVTADNAQQAATNSATVAPNVEAQSGPTAASGTGIAISGPAVAGAILVATQINIQVIAGWVPTGGVAQDASNDLDVVQDVLAASGPAAANGSGTAISGTPIALSIALVDQGNVQVFLGTDPDATGSVEQEGANAADLDLEQDAATGEALTSGGYATSGNSISSGLVTLDQLGLLIGVY